MPPYSSPPSPLALTTPIPEKRVSINSEPSVGEERQGRPRRKFLSADGRSGVLSRYGGDRNSPPAPDLSTSMDMRGAEPLSWLRLSSLTLSRSTPDLTEICGNTKKGAKAKHVERSNSKRLLGRSHNDTYLNSSQTPDLPTSPRHRTRSMSFSPRHSASSITSRIQDRPCLLLPEGQRQGGRVQRRRDQGSENSQVIPPREDASP